MERTLEALKDERRYRVVVTYTTTTLDGLTLGGNVAAVHSDILPHAACVVTHAGHGTLLATLAHDLPALCLPNPGSDQPLLFSTYSQHRAGLVLDITTDPANDITAAVEALLTDPRYKEGAERLQHSILEHQAKARPLRI